MTGEHGVLEPILVRKRPSGGFEIIAGERRWRAAQQAGLKDVPIFVHDLGDEAAFEAALVENLQREDLNPMETARAFQRLVDDYGYTQETITTKVGKERSTVANALRLLKLPKDVVDLIETGDLSEEGKSTNVRDLENRLSRALGSSTKIHESGKERGQVRISYSSFDELDRLIDKLT